MSHLELPLILFFVVLIASQTVKVWAFHRLSREQMMTTPNPTLLTECYDWLMVALVWVMISSGSSWTMWALWALFMGLTLGSVVHKIRCLKRSSLPASYIKTVTRAELSWIFCLVVLMGLLFGNIYQTWRDGQRLKLEAQESKVSLKSSEHS